MDKPLQPLLPGLWLVFLRSIRYVNLFAQAAFDVAIAVFRAFFYIFRQPVAVPGDPSRANPRVLHVRCIYTATLRRRS
ncbi:hypothetical protein [Paraburkholderia sp.]|uniref:hypothetical protein n=1 Tax=Paraburkholderia sp. TaxID=1926495 RepID=UPI003C76A056